MITFIVNQFERGNVLVEARHFNGDPDAAFFTVEHTPRLVWAEGTDGTMVPTVPTRILTDMSRQDAWDLIRLLQSALGDTE